MTKTKWVTMLTAEELTILNYLYQKPSSVLETSIALNINYPKTKRIFYMLRRKGLIGFCLSDSKKNEHDNTKLCHAKVLDVQCVVNQ